MLLVGALKNLRVELSAPIFLESRIFHARLRVPIGTNFEIEIVNNPIALLTISTLKSSAIGAAKIAVPGKFGNFRAGGITLSNPSALKRTLEKMTDDELAHFLVCVAGYVAHLHERSRQVTPSHLGSEFEKEDIRNWVDEGFARWMGYRGEEEQEREIRNVRNKPE